MAQRFRRPCSPAATKSNPAKPFSSSASFPTTSSQQSPLARKPLPNRWPQPQEKSRVQLRPRFARRSFLPLPCPRRIGLTSRPKLPHRLRQSKIDLPSARLLKHQDRRHPSRRRRHASASRPPSLSAVGPFTRFLTVGRSRKVLAFNKM